MWRSRHAYGWQFGGRQAILRQSTLLTDVGYSRGENFTIVRPFFAPRRRP
jgi:hypothetical protein